MICRASLEILCALLHGPIGFSLQTSNGISFAYFVCSISADCAILSYTKVNDIYKKRSCGWYMLTYLCPQFSLPSLVYHHTRGCFQTERAFTWLSLSIYTKGPLLPPIILLHMTESDFHFNGHHRNPTILLFQCLTIFFLEVYTDLMLLDILHGTGSSPLQFVLNKILKMVPSLSCLTIYTRRWVTTSTCLTWNWQVIILLMLLVEGQG